MKKHLLFCLFILYLAVKLNAQVTYTSTEYGSVGDSLLYTAVNVDTSSLNFAQAGANVNWNFSALVPYAQYDVDFLNPATAGYKTIFLGDCVAGGNTLTHCNSEFNSLTNLAFRDITNASIQNVVFTDIVTEDLKSTGSLETNIIGYTTKIGGVNVPLTSVLTSPDVLMKFPIAYGNSDSSTSGYAINLTASGVNFIYHEHSKRVNYADAFGSLSTPYATYASTIRLRSLVYQNDTLFYNNAAIPLGASISVEYQWFDPSYTNAVFTASGVVAGSTEKFQTVTYLDTVLCLTPTARSTYSPIDVVIDSSVGNAPVSFTNSSINADTYFWNFGNPTSGGADTSRAINPIHIYTDTGTYHLELIACNTACTPERCDTQHFSIMVRDSAQTHASFYATPVETCIEDTVHFHNTSTNATSYKWNFGDGHTSTQENPVHIYTLPGTYTVVLKVANGSTTSETDETITINSPPSAQINAIGATTFCNGDSVVLYASGGTIYHWSNGFVGPYIKVFTSGTYTVTATNSCGSGVSNPITVTVNTPLDTVTAAGSTTICQGDSVELKANTGSGLSYQWKKDGQIIIGATQSTYEATTQGIYSVDVTENGCKGISNVVHVSVGALPNASIYTQGSTVICANDSVLLQVATGDNDTYQWQLNNENIVGATSTTYSATASGTYNAVVTHNGCSNLSNAISVTTNPLPTPTLIYQGNPAICSGDSFYINASSGINYSYQWQRNNINIIGATGQGYYAKIAGTYRVVATSNGCTGASDSVVVSLNPSPTANAGTNQFLEACNAATVTIGGNPTASDGTGPNYTYLWAPAAGLNDSTIANPVASHLGSTTNYQVVVTDENGCTAGASVTITVIGASLSVVINNTGALNYCSGSGDSVQLQGDVSGGTAPFHYSWSPGNNLSSTTGDTTFANPSSPGVYAYSLLVTDHNGCEASASVSVTVATQPVAAITALDTIVLCAGDTTYLAASTDAGYSYQWLNNSSPVLNANSSIYAAADSGNYSVFVSSGICSAISNSVQVSLKPNPQSLISVIGGLTFCAGTAKVTITANTGNDYTYSWFDEGNLLQGDTSSFITVIDSGSFYAVVSLNGCSLQSNILSTTIIQPPSDSVSIFGATEFCQGENVTLSVSTGAGYVYQWFENGNSIPAATDFTYSADSSAVYNVQVTALGCTATSTGVQVIVDPYPPSALTASGNLTFCTGDSVVLDAPVGASYNYTWLLNSNGELDSLDYVTQTITATDSGSYDVVISNNSCITTSNSLYVTELTLPDAQANITGDGYVCSGFSDTIYAQTGNGYTYQWFSENNPIPGATSDIYIATDSGTYAVLVTDANCTASSNYVVFSYDSCPTGIAVISENTMLSVYPNPAHESLIITWFSLKESPVSFRLYDIIGNQLGPIYTDAAVAGNNFYSLSVSALPQGVYLLKFYDANATITKRIIRE